MNFSKQILAVMLLAALAAGVGIGVLAKTAPTKKEAKPKTTALPTKEQTERMRQEENARILANVDDYQAGYQEGCQIAADKPPLSKPKEPKSPAYQLGLERGETICRLEIKRIKALKEQGYKEGCSSAEGKLTQDKRFYQSSRPYREAWDEGKQACTKKVAKKAEPEVSATKKSPREERYHGDPSRNGYNDGCDTATGSFTQDREAYRRSARYREEWHKGERECGHRRSYEESPYDRDTRMIYPPQGFYPLEH